MSAPQRLPEWSALLRHASRLSDVSLSALCAQPSRFTEMSARSGNLLLDLSKQRLDRSAMTALLALAERCGVSTRRTALFTDNKLNPTEGRAVLHTALRGHRPESVGADVEQTLERIRDISTAIRDGTWRGAGGAAIRHVVHIGIGGSALGPDLALEGLADCYQYGPACTILANIDGSEFQRKVEGLVAERTLFIVASKSFSTTETLVNAESARGWLLERGVAPSDLHKHMIGITSNLTAAERMGIGADHVLPLWDWVGGRFSLWSAIGLIIAVRYGFDVFERLLAGAAAMDEHFRSAPLASNLPVLGAMSELWNVHFLGAESTAILAYDHRLRLLPAHLQQLCMESNGKQTHLDGTPVSGHTAPIVWGGEGTNGQHAYHQLLHQGTRAVNVEFVLSANPNHQLHHHHDWLMANAVGQGQALMAGKDDENPHRRMPGGRGSTLLLIDELTPESLGALIAYFEHRVFVQGTIWQVNSFDQWGVELGKVLAARVNAQLHETQPAAEDAATTQLLRHLAAQVTYRRQPLPPESDENDP